MALDNVGQRIRCDSLVNRFVRVLILHVACRKLQQNLRLARRGVWLYDLDMVISHGDPAWRRTGWGNGAPDGSRHYVRGAETHGRAGC
jgi:hypothetical protein